MDAAALPLASPPSLGSSPASAQQRPTLAIGETIGLSPRIVQALSRAGIDSFEELASFSDAELLQIPDLGFAALGEIRETLRKLDQARAEMQSSAPRETPARTPLEQELWHLTAAAGGDVERGIAMVYFGWDGRLSIEEIRDRYRVRREMLRRIFLAVETQPPPDRRKVRALRLTARFLAAHCPIWQEEAQGLLQTAGLVHQGLTITGLQQACRIAALPTGFSFARTPRVLLVNPNRLDDCRLIVRTVQHLAALRATTSIDEVKSCTEKMLRRDLDRKFVRRSMALLPTLRWLDHRLGLVTLSRSEKRRAKSE